MALVVSGTSTPDHHSSAFHTPQYKSHTTAPPQRPTYTTTNMSPMTVDQSSHNTGTHSSGTSSHIRDMSRQGSGSSIGSYNAITRQTSATGPVPIIPTPTRYVDSTSHTTTHIPASTQRHPPVERIPRAKSVGPGNDEVSIFAS